MSKYPLGYCQCGCGQKTRVSPKTVNEKGWIKGRPRNYINGHNGRGSMNVNWKGGKRDHIAGYIEILCPGHPRAGNRNYILEHILVIEKVLGKCLPPKAVGHHVNNDGKDNRNQNLVACQDRAYHFFLHQRQRAYRACGHANWRKCVHCKQYDSPEKLIIKPKKAPFHWDCRTLYNRQRSLKNKKSPSSLPSGPRGDKMGLTFTLGVNEPTSQ